MVDLPLSMTTGVHWDLLFFLGIVLGWWSARQLPIFSESHGHHQELSACHPPEERD
jgi:hypothetical protein